MEKKTIGRFICALRKANGMTQKQLAERLNVSDKSVSRWERDECAPDLMLIPVIAEIFGVTSDEILKGERNNPENEVVYDDYTPKAQKQIKRLLESAKIKFKTRSIIAAGVACISPVAAWLFDYGLDKSWVGFFVGLAITIVSIMLEIVFIVSAFSRINSDEFDKEDVGKYKISFLRISELTISAELCLFALIIPLAFLSYSEFVGFIYAAILAIICVLISWLINTRAVSNGFYYVNDDERQKIIQVNRLRKKYLIIFIVLFAVTSLLGQLPFNQSIDATDVVSGEIFTDVEAFVKYMETSEDLNEESVIGRDDVMITENKEDNEAFEDDDGIEEYIENEKGDVILKFVTRNENVHSFYVNWKNDNEIESIETYTFSDLRHGNKILDIINICWCAAYAIEFAVVLAVYERKKAGDVRRSRAR